METLASRLAAVQEKIAQAALDSGRPEDSVRLVAVSKTKPAEAVSEAFTAGQILFGENRVQELENKVPALPSEIRWHLIGHLQKNKVRKVLPLISCIESVDSLALASRIDRIAGELGLQPDLLLQVNISSDPAKSGFEAATLPSHLEALASLENVGIRGLMTIPEFSPDPEDSRPHFSALRELRDQLVTSSGLQFPELSMGMSGDFPVAIEEGATLVRVGTAIFGSRA